MMVSFWTGTGPCQRSTGSAGRKDFTLPHGGEELIGQRWEKATAAKLPLATMVRLD